jgi:hypothetical protein
MFSPSFGVVAEFEPVNGNIQVNADMTISDKKIMKYFISFASLH